MKTFAAREVYTGESSLLPELPMVAWTRRQRAQVPGLLPHRHENVFEIFFLERGSVEWWVEDEVHLLRANTVYMNRPGEQHGSKGPCLQPCGYYWVQIKFPPSGLHGMSPSDSSALERELWALRTRTWPGTSELQACFMALLGEHRTPRPLQLMCARARLHLLLGELLRSYRQYSSVKSDSSFSFSVRRAVRLIESNLAEIHSVGQLAKDSGLGTTRFAERFLSETGYTPAQFLRRQRIERAKLLLRGNGENGNDVDITEIAHSLGFCSSQHFATVFRRLEGVTPSEFRRAVGNTQNA